MADNRELDRIGEEIAANDVVLFMKGTPQFPQCGFSAAVTNVLSQLGVPFKGVDVLADDAIRQGIKAFSNWPTIPQVYVKGEFVGGCDIITELFENGELATTLGVEAIAAVEPSVTITDTAVERLRKAFEESGGPGRDLQISIDARYQEEEPRVGGVGDEDLGAVDEPAPGHLLRRGLHIAEVGSAPGLGEAGRTDDLALGDAR